MVGPVTSNVAQQAPLQNSQQNSASAVENRSLVERELKEKETRPSGTSTAETQGSETRNNGNQTRIPANDQQDEIKALIANGSRGSVVDITV